MLDELRVRNIALIQDATLTFSPGFTVLTGETGAGKTALLNAIKLLIGERAEAAMVRDGATEACVEALFVDAGHDIVVKRRLGADGRSKCSLDDELVTVGALARHVGPLVDLHGQHEHQTLLSPAIQLEYLDGWIGQDACDARLRYEAAWDRYVAATAYEKRVREALEASAQELEEARFAFDEIGRVDPKPDEHLLLEEELPRLRNGESLARAATEALETLRDERGAIDDLAIAQHALACNRGVDARLDALIDRLESLVISAEDLAGELRVYRDDVEFDPEALQEALDRLGAIEGLRKKYGPRIEDIFTRWEEAAGIIEADGTSEEQQQKAATERSEAEDALENAAANLAAVRMRASVGFTEALSASVHDLAMEGSSFELSATALERSAWTRNGSVRYELLYRPGPASMPRPLAKIASGGELSRVMLALKTLLENGDTTRTLVFDEIDAGIGGAAAVSVAKRLEQLAQSHQVIVVTHLAQIASVAHKHLVVRKSNVGPAVVTTIDEAEGEERVGEIARMLAGNRDSVALEHARTLMHDVGEIRQ